MKLRMLIACFVLSCVSLQAQEWTVEEGYSPLPETHLDAYFKQRPQGFLTDPQGLLRGSEARDRREFLEYLASDSPIDLHVVLLKGDQLFPGDGTDDRLERWYGSGKPAVIIIYYMGRPERSEMHLTRKLNVVPMDERAKALESAIERARTGVTPVDELEQFMLQTSIRIERMARLLSEGTASPAPIIQEEPKQVESEDQGKKALIQHLSGFWSLQKYKLIGAVVLISLLFFLRRWQGQRAAFRFPETDGPERMGGVHGAGVGAIIYFGKASPPPAAQLEKLKLH